MIVWLLKYLAGRLEDVWQDGALVAHYAYDENGNRVGATEGGVTTTGTDDVQDRLLAWGDTTFTYGRRGDLQSRTDASGSTGYVTDALGNLVSATLPDGTSLSYVIDANNRRIGKRRGGVLQQGFLYDGQLRIVAELNGANALESRYIYGTRGNVPDLMVRGVRGGITYRLLSDHLGSVRLVVRTSNGAVVQRLDYDEWGNVLVDTNPGFQPFGFGGGLYDRDTRLVRFGARDYDPEIGRWISKDPIRFRGGDTNLYAYSRNDPVNLIDPSGLASLCSALRWLADQEKEMGPDAFVDKSVGESGLTQDEFEPPNLDENGNQKPYKRGGENFEDNRWGSVDVNYVQVAWGLTKKFGGGGAQALYYGYQGAGAVLGPLLDADPWTVENWEQNDSGFYLGLLGATGYDTFGDWVDAICNDCGGGGNG